MPGIAISTPNSIYPGVTSNASIQCSATFKLYQQMYIGHDPVEENGSLEYIFER